MKRFAALLAMAGLVACSDGPTAPPQASSIQIQAAGAPISEQVLEVGKSVQLTAVVQMTRGGTQSPVAWRSTAPAIASVDNAGIVTGVSPGVAFVIASADLVADTVRVTVTQPPPADVTCGPEQPTLNLGVGEVYQARANEVPLLCLPGSSSGAEYMMMPYFASTSASSLPIEFYGGRLISPVQPPSPSVSPSASLSASPASTPREPAEDWQFHMRMREVEKSLLSSRARPAMQPSFSISTMSSSPAVGSVLRLNASTEACTNAKWRGARVEAVTSRAIVVADTLNPANGFTTADYQAFGAEFDSRVWPVVTTNFGTPSDVDANERVIIFFTVAVNELTTPGSGSYVGGFYHPRDLYPTSSCATSNHAEVLYQLVPDPARAAANSEPFLNKDAVQRRTVAVIGHELQHLINASTRIFKFDAPVETVWLNEGLSHIAEELIFYHEAGLGPKQNIVLSDLQGQTQANTAVNRHQISNLGRFISFLQNPQDFNFADGNDLGTRGGSWAFLRYAADRRASPGQQQQLWFNLVNTSNVGIQNVTQVFGFSSFAWFQDWTVAVLLDDTSIPTDERFRQPSWNFRSVLPAITSGNAWPLQTRTLIDGQSLDVTLRAGGTSYVRVAVAAGTTGGVRLTANRIAPPETLRLSIVRTR
jgi:hypothetical protein